MARLLSVNVGQPRDVSWRGARVHTGIWKRPAAGPCLVRRLNVDGDGQGDLAEARLPPGAASGRSGWFAWKLQIAWALVFDQT